MSEIARRPMSEEVFLSTSQFLPESTDRSKPPIVLLHGLTSTKDSWKRCTPLIANKTNRKVIVFDARNHGQSGSGEHDYHIMADDLKRLLKFLKISKAIIMGHSMGGKTAMLFALQYPELVEKLIIEDIAVHHSSPKLINIFTDYFASMEKAIGSIPNEATTLDEAKKHVSSFLKNSKKEENSRRSNDTELEVPLKQNEKGRFEWSVNLQFLKNVNWTAMRKLYVEWMNNSHLTYSGPTLFIYGSESPYEVPKDKEFLLRKFPSAVFEGIQDATHLLHTEYPEQFCNITTQFINHQ